MIEVVAIYTLLGLICIKINAHFNIFNENKILYSRGKSQLKVLDYNDHSTKLVD